MCKYRYFQIDKQILHYNGIQGRILVNYRCTNKDINSFIHICICRSEVLGPNPRAQFEFFCFNEPVRSHVHINGHIQSKAIPTRLKQHKNAEGMQKIVRKTEKHPDYMKMARFDVENNK